MNDSQNLVLIHLMTLKLQPIIILKDFTALSGGSHVGGQLNDHERFFHPVQRKASYLHLQITPQTSIEITLNLLRKHNMPFLGHLNIMEQFLLVCITVALMMSYTNKQ